MDGTLIFVYIAIPIVLVVIVFRSRCPNCGKVFGGLELSRKTTQKAGRFKNEIQLVTYQCGRCNHVWCKEKTINNSGGNYW